MRDHARRYCPPLPPTSQQGSPQRAPGVAPLPRQGRPVDEPTRGNARSGDAGEPGYVIHLPIHVEDLTEAARLAYTVAGSLAFLREIDPGETTVSTVDDQNNRYRVFCDLPLPDRSRCPRPYDHPGRCGHPGPGREEAFPH